MNSCPACGAPVQTARDTDGNFVVLDQGTDASSDAPRFRIVTQGKPLVVERVPDAQVGDFYPLHAFDCPHGNAGRTF